MIAGRSKHNPPVKFGTLNESDELEPGQDSDRAWENTFPSSSLT